MAIIRGKNLVVAIDSSGTDVVIGAAKDCTLTTSMAMLDISNKDSGAAKEFMPDDYDWTVSANAFYDPTKTLNYEEIMAYLQAGTQVKINVGVPGTGYPVSGSFYEGNAYVSSCNLSGAYGDSSTLAVEFRGTGVLTPKSYAAGGSMS